MWSGSSSRFSGHIYLPRGMWRLKVQEKSGWSWSGGCGDSYVVWKFGVEWVRSVGGLWVHPGGVGSHQGGVDSIGTIEGFYGHSITYGMWCGIRPTPLRSWCSPSYLQAPTSSWSPPVWSSGSHEHVMCQICLVSMGGSLVQLLPISG